MTEHKDLVGQEPFSMTHRMFFNRIILNTTQMELPQDVLVVLKEHEESNEIFWLSGPESIIKDSNDIFWLIDPESKSSINLPFDVLSPGTTTVKVYTLEKVYCKTGLMIYHNEASSLELNLNITQIPPAPTKKPDLTLQEMETLMSKAIDYMSPQSMMYPLKHLYRNKSPSYYDSILKLHDGVMETYCKDYNGDEGSCINGVIDGLFFSAGLDRYTKKPLDFSYFGKKRLYIPPQMIITKDTNMYFSDFYCHNVQHYVTVVVTKSGSHADDFCKGRLLQLDAEDNQFICTENFQSFSVTTPKVSVEIFYTEDIDITSLKTKPGVEFTEVRIGGIGKSMKYGIPKRKYCTICQL
ncbi:phytanoyl-CoA hydroxylase-interacting protein-like [Gigantopelta aegis]|uniref:phytanoyl-CoA hydroxylase-interacting protein-like n=1 Tax=Gigantopelta aegis TaxID=1735272 RepID=UPI001B888ABA|nr:phytanoyl-CoA hydroxylase-interacting protein-like [Gigantopelta aegis]